MRRGLLLPFQRASKRSAEHRAEPQRRDRLPACHARAVRRRQDHPRRGGAHRRPGVRLCERCRHRLGRLRARGARGLVGVRCLPRCCALHAGSAGRHGAHGRRAVLHLPQRFRRPLLLRAFLPPPRGLLRLRAPGCYRAGSAGPPVARGASFPGAPGHARSADRPVPCAAGQAPRGGRPCRTALGGCVQRAVHVRCGRLQEGERRARAPPRRRRAARVRPAALEQSFRRTDIVFRAGGDEFSAFVADIPCVCVAERICSDVIAGVERLSWPRGCR